MLLAASGDIGVPAPAPPPRPPLENEAEAADDDLFFSIDFASIFVPILLVVPPLVLTPVWLVNSNGGNCT